MTPATFAMIGLITLATSCFLYIVPSIIAFRREHPNRWAILQVNVFLGSTGIG